MLYGHLQGEVAAACHVFGGTGVVNATFLGAPFNAGQPSRIGPGFYSVALGSRITPFHYAAVAVSDQGIPAQIAVNGADVLAGKAAAVLFRDSTGTLVDTNFYLVIVRTSV